jgi:hypothetical protein
VWAKPVEHADLAVPSTECHELLAETLETLDLTNLHFVREADYEPAIGIRMQAVRYF